MPTERINPPLEEVAALPTRNELAVASNHITRKTWGLILSAVESHRHPHHHYREFILNLREMPEIFEVIDVDPGAGQWVFPEPKFGFIRFVVSTWENGNPKRESDSEIHSKYVLYLSRFLWHDMKYLAAAEVHRIRRGLFARLLNLDRIEWPKGPMVLLPGDKY